MRFDFTITIVLFCCCVTSSALADSFGENTLQFEIDFVTIGNIGNSPDLTGTPNPAGSVGYQYAIAKFEVSREMVEKANTIAGLEITMTAVEFTPGPEWHLNHRKSLACGC